GTWPAANSSRSRTSMSGVSVCWTRSVMVIDFTSSSRGRDTKRPSEDRRSVSGRLLLVATLVASLAKQLAVLLLRHALAALLDDRTHGNLTTSGVGRHRKPDARVRAGKMPRDSLANRERPK